MSYSDNGLPLLHCKKSGCSFRQLKSALQSLGVYPGQPLGPDRLKLMHAGQSRDQQAKVQRAFGLFDEARTIDGTIGETYLRNRGIDCELPETLRFHPACYHGPTKQYLPAVLAIVTGPTDFPGAIHRTFLSLSGEKLEHETSKMALGSCKHGAVLLARGTEKVVAVSEGIETGLSLLSGILKPTFGEINVVSGLSATGVASLRLPQLQGWKLIIASDGDDAGELAAAKLSIHGKEQGYIVYHSPAPKGQDWNDVLRGVKVDG